MGPLPLSFLLAFLAALAEFIGGSLTVLRRPSKLALLNMTGLAAGFILAAVLIDRVPEVMHGNPQGQFWLLAGFLAIYLIENLFSTHAHVHDHQAHVHVHEPPGLGHGHSLVSRFQSHECLITPVASYAAFAGLALHTFLDGVAIAAGFAASPQTGYLMFLAVIFHKLPDGFSVSSLMLAAGRGRRMALGAAAALGLCTISGALAASLISGLSPASAPALLALATGSFLYIGASDLIPATNVGQDQRVYWTVLLGVLLYLLASWAIPNGH
ncbi:MAG TPA: ZIP family metal transporter [Candidatus Nitrosotenuis sp.]|nr:ZIP family metal transporter [Candidatus Nitrosotenuis sp.]